MGHPKPHGRGLGRILGLLGGALVKSPGKPKESPAARILPFAIKPGEVRNPVGRNQYSYRRDFERAADALLRGVATEGERRRLGLDDDLLALIPEDATRGEILAFVTILRAEAGDEKVYAEVMARLWPKVERREIGDFSVNVRPDMSDLSDDELRSARAIAAKVGVT